MGRLASIALGAGRADSKVGRDVVDIITFMEAPWGLGMALFPAQRVIIKAFYGVPLDNNPHGFDLTSPIPTDHPAYAADLVDVDGYYRHRVVISDWRREKFRVMTEEAYLQLLHAEGRCNISQVVPGQERRELVLSLGRRSGKCVVGDTLVLTDRGVIPIRELGVSGGAEFQPLTVGVVQEGGTRAQSAYFYDGGTQPTYRVQTHLGLVIEGTASHRVKVMGADGLVDWRRLDDVREGDCLAVHRSADLWASEEVDVQPYHVPRPRKVSAEQPRSFTPSWALLLGYLVGDGCWTDRRMLRVTVAHPETHEEVRDLLQDLCGRVSFHEDKRGKSGLGTLYVCDKALREFLHNLGFDWNKKSDDKQTPWVVLRSPKQVVRAYLQGLFETDGTVSANGNTVSFCSASWRLAHETQVLLLNMGVVSRLRVKHNKEYDRDYYEVIIRGLRSRRVFATEVGFRSEKKQGRLLAGLDGPQKEGGDTESVPHQRSWVSRLLESVACSRPRHGWQRSTLRAVLGGTCKPGEDYDLTYARIRAILPVAVDLQADKEVIQHFQDLLRMDYCYDSVASVSRGGAPVFDLNVPEGSSFVAGGLTNHNTELSSCISAYETYRLLSKGDPQKYYGIPPSENIQLISFATDKDQAGILYQKVSGYFRACTFFAPYTANNTQTYARFQTPADIERYGSYHDDQTAKATIKVTFRSSVAKGSRGPGNIVVILDEMAHFTDNGQSSADAVYKAVTPSTATFSPKDPRDRRKATGPVESKIIAISSPLGQQGVFYDLFRTGFHGNLVGNRLCVQAPTWEVNPTIPVEFFESEYVKDPHSFFTEFGADFASRSLTWIEDAKDLLACVDPELRPARRAPPRTPHFMGVDIGLVGDPSAVVIGHNDEQGRVVVDLVESIKAGEGAYEGLDRLEFAGVADWIHDFTKRFYIVEGIFDQWAGIPLEQALNARGLKQLTSVHHTGQLSSQMYQNFKDLMYDKRLVLYDWPIPDGGDHCDYITELLELQKEYKSKYVTVVEAPKGQGKHDDLSDALVRMVWIASKNVSKVIAFGGAGRTSNLRGAAPHRLTQQAMMQARRKAMLSGSSPERQLPKSAVRRGATSVVADLPRTLAFGRRGGGRGGR